MKRFDEAAFARLTELIARRPAIHIEPGEYRRAGVIIPFVPSDGGWRLLFCRRAEDLRTHSGQISFPGGGVHAGETAEEGAKRETEEEVGVPASAIEVRARLDDLVTISGYVVAPYVARIPPDLPYVLQESEVVEAFEVGIDVLLEPRNPEVRYIVFRGRRYPTYFYIAGEREIWGLTGRIVKSLLDLVRLVL